MIFYVVALIHGLGVIFFFFNLPGFTACFIERISPGFGSAHGSHGELFFQIATVTGRAIRRLIELYNFLEMMIARFAFVFINRHMCRIHQSG